MNEWTNGRGGNFRVVCNSTGDNLNKNEIVRNSDSWVKNDLTMRKMGKKIHTWLVNALIPSSVEIAQRICCVDDDEACIGAQNRVCWTEASNFDVVEKMSAGVNNIQCKHKFIANLLL